MDKESHKHPTLGKLTRWACRRPRKKPTKKVAILIPLTDREGFTADEEISLGHLRHYLGDYDKFFLLPKGNVAEVEGIEMVHFPKKYFGTVDRHAHLLWATWFYRRFDDYEYILFYQLDALVFSDQLAQWCEAGWDYLAPPWLVSDQSPWVTEPGVGNGGFCLVNVGSVLELLYCLFEQDPCRYWMAPITRNPRWFKPLIAALRGVRRLVPKSRLVNRALDEWESMTGEEMCAHGRAADVFWGLRAVNYHPDWKVASVEEALRFGFEVEPSRCFELNGREMPFGCHAFARYERSFWEPHMLKPERGVGHRP